MKIFVAGAGRCGRALAEALDHAGHEIVGAWTRSRATAQQGRGAWETAWGPDRPAALDPADVVLVSVSEVAIDAVGAWVLPHQVALHTAGAVLASRLRAAGGSARSVAAFHPLQSFAAVTAGPEHVRGISFGLEGEAEAVAIARGLATDMGAHSFEVTSEDAKAQYHAACCVASNALVALADQAVTIFAGSGVSRAEALRALVPLMAGTVSNLGRVDEARQALTGPIARGDEAVIARHEQAIQRLTPDSLDDYRAVSAAVRRVNAPRLGESG